MLLGPPELGVRPFPVVVVVGGCVEGAALFDDGEALFIPRALPPAAPPVAAPLVALGSPAPPAPAPPAGPVALSVDEAQPPPLSEVPGAHDYARR
jgi:hypothetical protein